MVNHEILEAFDQMHKGFIQVETKEPIYYVERSYDPIVSKIASAVNPFERLPIGDFLQSKFAERFTEIRALQDDWDGYEGYAPLPSIIEKAEKFIGSLPSKYIHHLSESSILPNPNGTITIEWSKGDNILSLEIGRDTANFYTSIDGLFDSEEGIAFLETHIPVKFIRSINKIIG